MFLRVSLLILLFFSFSSCTSKVTILKGTDKEIYDSIVSEVNKKRKWLILGGTDYGVLEDLITTLQIRYPYSIYTREIYLLSGEVSYKRKRWGFAINRYQEFIKNHPSHPKVNYAKYKIFKSNSKLMRDKDNDINPALDIIKMYETLTDDFKQDEYFKDTTNIYSAAKKFVLKRAIYISRFYIKKEEYKSAYSRIENAKSSIPEMVSNSYEAQYLLIFCLSKMKDHDYIIEDLKNEYKKKFPKSPFLKEINKI